MLVPEEWKTGVILLLLKYGIERCGYFPFLEATRYIIHCRIIHPILRKKLTGDVYQFSL